MRTVLLLSLPIIFMILIMFTSCDKSSDKITNNLPEENLLCGDADGNGVLNILDVSAVASYCFLEGKIDDLVMAETDNIKGITINDALLLGAYLYLEGDPPICSHDMPDTVLPLSDDTIFVSDRTIPTGVEDWGVKISLKLKSPCQAIVFPFHYDCLDSSIICDSIVYHIYHKNTAISKPSCPFLTLDSILIDTLNQIGLILYDAAVFELPADSISLASIWFSLTPSADSQMISIDTTTYPPSNYLMLSRFEAPATIASMPVIVYE